MAQYDLSVAQQAYQTARALNASDKVMLALFEAGIVESGMRNLSFGDRDSVGFLQQRPSQGWGTKEQCMNVAYATTKFVTEAKKVESRYATAGQLAQAVQRSAYPFRYDQQRTAAVTLLAQVKGMSGGTTPEQPDVVNVGDDDGLGGFVNLVTDSHTWLRLGMLMAGFSLLMVGLALIGWNNAPASAKTAAKAVILKKVPLK